MDGVGDRVLAKLGYFEEPLCLFEYLLEENVELDLLTQLHTDEIEDRL